MVSNIKAFGKIMQDRSSVSINRTDTSISRSKQLDSAIPPSTIATLSSGEFIGMVGDDPDCKIELKSFHCQILNDHEKLKKEQHNYKAIPVIRKVDNGMIQRNYLSIKTRCRRFVEAEMFRLMMNPNWRGRL
jgi:TusA-related sulfurtransferase